MWGFFSNEFVHIGTGHASLEMPIPYLKNDDTLGFVKHSIVSVAFFLSMITELVFADEISHLQYWKPESGGYTFDPKYEVIEWLERQFPNGE